MMNIAFYTNYKPTETKGGIEHVTVNIASFFSKNGIKCFSIYKIDSPGDAPCSIIDYLRVTHNSIENCIKLETFLLKNNVTKLIVQGDLNFSQNYSLILKRNRVDVYFAHHFSPMWECEYFNIKNLYNDFSKEKTHFRKMKLLFKIFFFPFYKYKYNRIISQKYKYNIINSKKVILLSDKFVDSYCRFAKYFCFDSFLSIPNSLSYEYVEPNCTKEKIVLMVCRLEELSKRIKLALKIWVDIQKRLVHSQKWKFVIVGDGDDGNVLLYREYVKKNNIGCVEFVGRQNPLPYYMKAKILFMTSKREGFPLVLTEAMQNKVVPIVFNTFSSLPDLVQDGVNGYIIPNNNISLFTQRAIELMCNDIKMHEMANSAYKSCEKFKPEIVLQCWMEAICN